MNARTAVRGPASRCSSRLARWCAGVALAAATLACVSSAPPALALGKARQLADSVAGVPGLPTGAPPAASAPEPALPTPSSAEWPFPSDFSHTSGTGLLAGGADPRADGMAAGY